MDTGMRFGRLTVVAGHRTTGKHTWQNCLCDCGTLLEVRRDALRGGYTKSCGCLHRDTHTTHGKHLTKTYTAWQQMRQRCLNPLNKDFACYGGRGITVDPTWSNFEQFLADMGEAPPEHSLGRHDNNQGYAPGNCRWETWRQQARNKRNTRHLTVGGVTRPLADWADASGVKAGTIRARLRNGWTPEAAVKKAQEKEEGGS